MPNKGKRPFVSAVIVCAGSASRMGGVDKLFLPIGNSTVLERSVTAFEKAESIGEIVIVTKSESMEVVRKLVDDCGMIKVSCIIAGGSTRQQSVQKGVAACSASADYFAVHDGARPLVTPQVINSTIADAVRYGASTAAVKVKDTVKLAGPKGLIKETLDRDFLYAIQTPQVFRRDLYKQGIAGAAEQGGDYTDDCQLLEAAGIPVFLSQGSYDNIKITTPEDISVAEALLKRRESI